MRLDATIISVLIGYVFVGIVTELENCRIYEVILLIIYVAISNLLGASNFIV
jgi:hypothetical protein